MPHFKDAEEVYANLGRLFEDIIADEDLRARFQRAEGSLMAGGISGNGAGAMEAGWI